MELDNAKTLFEHIRNRLPTGYGLGDDNKVQDPKTKRWNHQTAHNSIREDCEGDVGIFEIYKTPIKTYNSSNGYDAELQLVVICVDGDTDNAENYLLQTVKNLKQNKSSEGIYIGRCRVINFTSFGKTVNGLQTVIINLKINYLIK